MYDAVLAKFDAFFNVRKYIIFERARFNRRNQQARETAEQYIMDLYELSANCEYGDMTEEMVCDRLVVLSECLQLDPDLTPEKAKKAIRQREAVHEQQQVLKGGVGPSHLEALHSDCRTRRPQSGSKGSHKNKTSTKQCTRCGKGTHPREKCPAKDAKCHRCQRKGHYGAMCYAKTVANVS